MARDITVTFEDGSKHVYKGAPDDVKPDVIQARAFEEFGKPVIAMDGGREAALERSAGQRALESVGAVASGINRGFVSRAGLPFNPVDVIANVLDLGKAAIGAPYIAATGKAPPSWLEVGGRGDVVGSGEWLIDTLRKYGVGRATLDAPHLEDQGGYLQAFGAGVGSGGRAAPISGGLSAVSGKAVGDLTGNDAMAVAASMAPTAAKLGVGSAARAAAVPRDLRAAELARLAIEKYRIPLNMADTTDSRFIKAARSTMNDTPILASMGAAQDAGKQPAFNRAVGSTFGANAGALTPDVLRAAASNMGGKFDALWNRNALEVDARLFTKLQEAKAEAAKLPQGDRQRLMSWVRDIESQMQPGQNGAPTIPGEIANRYQSKLRGEVESASGFLKTNLSDLRTEMLAAFNRSVAPQDAQALTAVRGQWKAFKTVEPLLEKSDAGVAGRLSGDVPPALLPNAVAKSYSNASGTQLGELSQIGGRFMVNRVPQTGGSTRAMLQNTVLGGGLLTAAGAASPVAAAGGAVTAGLLQKAIGDPKLARQLLTSGLLSAAEIQVLANVPGLLEK